MVKAFGWVPQLEGLTQTGHSLEVPVAGTFGTMRSFHNHHDNDYYHAATRRLLPSSCAMGSPTGRPYANRLRPRGPRRLGVALCFRFIYTYLMYIYIYIYIFMYVYKYNITCMYVYIYNYIRTCTDKTVYIYIKTHTHTHIYIYIYMYEYGHIKI